MSDKWKVFVVMLAAVIAAAIGEALAAKGMKATQHGEMPLMMQVRAAVSDWRVIGGFSQWSAMLRSTSTRSAKRI